MAKLLESDLAVHTADVPLLGKKLAVCVGGGVGAIQAPLVIRQLRRLGAARVSVFAAESALRFVGEQSLQWASGERVTVQPSGFAEHIARHDAVLVCPATASLLGKVRSGVCGDGPTTLVLSALGQGIPGVVAPSMHDSLFLAPPVQEALGGLQSWGVRVALPRREEGKQKVAGAEALALEVAHAVNRRPIPLRAIVTWGGTRVPLDPVRSISNLSTGALGRALVAALYARGVEVSSVRAHTQVAQLPPLLGVEETGAPEFEDFARACALCVPAQGLFHLAAVSDFITEPSGTKLSSLQLPSLALRAAPKLRDLPNFQSVPVRFLCKLTRRMDDAGRQEAEAFFQTSQASYLLWNSAGSLEPEAHMAELWSRAGERSTLEGKQAIARRLASVFVGGVP